MSSWKQWMKEPKGALPGGLVTKAGIALITVLVAGLLFSSSLSGPDETAEGVAPTEPRPVDDRTGRALDGRLSAETDRQSQQAAADADRQRRQSDAAEQETDRQNAGADAGNAGTQVGVGQAEFELSEALRLEEVERRTRSLRSLPVAQSRRDPNQVRDAGAVSSLESESPDAALDGALASLGQSLAALEAEMAAGLAAEEFAPGVGGAALRTGPPSSRTSEPGRLVRPLDPPGWERIREGSFLEAVLLTQLSGEFPGPVLATVSVPLYSADRQRVLIPRGARVVGTAIPRGARVVGTASAVQNRDQSRLAVAFHRLLLPDESWIDLDFAGLNQVGESALRD